MNLRVQLYVHVSHCIIRRYNRTKPVPAQTLYMYQVLLVHFGVSGNEAKTRTTDGNHSMLTASNYYTAESLPKLLLSHHTISCCYGNTNWHAADMLHCRFKVNQIFGVQ